MRRRPCSRPSTRPRPRTCRRGQRRDRSRARGLDRRDQPERARPDQRPRQRRRRLRPLRAGAGAAAVARRGGDPADRGQHLPRPPPARRPLRPRAPAGHVQPRGRGPGQLRRGRGPGHRPPARRRPTRRPSGWARSATATRCAGCSRPAAATGATARAPALSFEEPRAGRFGWHFDSEGQQHVVCELEQERSDIVVVGLGEPWYIDLKELSCGRIETGVPHRVTRLLLRAPAVPAAVASLVRQKLQPSAAALPLPEPLRKRERQEMRPTPILHLHCPRVTISRGLGWKREEQEVDLPLARVLFDYAGAEIGWQDGRTEINHVKDNRLLVLPRDTLFEVQMIERLNVHGLQPLGPTGLGRFAPEHCRQDFTFEEDEDDDVSMRWVEFNHQDLPKLARRRLAHHLRRGLSLPGRRRPTMPGRSTSTIPASTGSTSTSASRSTASAWRCCRSCSTCSSARPDDLTPAALDDDRRGPRLRHAARRPAPADPGAPPQGDARSALRAVRQPPDRRRRHAAPEPGRDDPADRDRDRAAERRPAVVRRPDPARHGAAPRHHQRDPAGRSRPRASRPPCATTRRTASPGCSS